MNVPILLAAGGAATVIIVLLMIVIPLIGVLTSKLRDAMQSPMPPPTGQAGSPRIQEQIDEFLRRAAQRRTGGQPAAPERPVEAVVVEEDEPVGDRVGRESQKYLDTSEFRRRTEQLGEEVERGEEQFVEQVQKAFSGEVGRLATRRGETARPVEVQAADVAAAAAADASRPTLDALPVAGSGLGDLLGDSNAIVQAIIMSEILRKPEWDAR